MKKNIVALLTLLVAGSLVLAGCPDDDEDDQDTGMPEDTMEMDTSEDTSMDTEMDAADTVADTDDDDAGDVEECTIEKPLAVDGDLALHPLAVQADMNTTLENTELSLITALSALGGTPSVLPAGEDCAPAVTSFTTTEQMASWSFDSVDVNSVIQGLVALVDDAEGSSEDNFVATATGLAGGEIADDMPDDVTGSQAFVLSTAAEQALAEANGGSAGDLISDGFILGMFVDSNGDPVSGIKVGEVTSTDMDDNPTEAAAIDKAIYPNSDLTDVTTGADGGSTSDLGVFIVPQATLKPYVGTTGDMGEIASSSQQGASAAGVAFVMNLVVTNNN
jgi:hypothetical protein